MTKSTFKIQDEATKMSFSIVRGKLLTLPPKAHATTAVNMTQEKCGRKVQNLSDTSELCKPRNVYCTHLSCLSSFQPVVVDLKSLHR